MNYQEALQYIHGTNRFGSVLGLESIRFLLKLMGNPQSELRFIHVAGTNGKGSTSAFISQVLIEDGYSVGLFTSPYLEVFNERIRLNGHNIENPDLATCTEYVQCHVEKMLKLGMNHPTEFELVTAIAMEFFKRQKVDFVVLEVGLGGRLDSTNIIERPLLSVITPIALDHVDILGDTLDKIAHEKAGIIKNKSLVITAPQKPEAFQVLKSVAEEKKSCLIEQQLSQLKIHRADIHGARFDVQFEDEIYTNLEIQLAGVHQIENAHLALTALKAANDHHHMNIRRESILKGLRNTRWAGRLEVLHRDPLILIDGAHNVHGAESMATALDRFLKGKTIVGVVGVLQDKDVSGILEKTMPFFSRVICTQPENPRALGAKALSELIHGYGISTQCIENPMDAVTAAMRTQREDEVLIVFGSLYLIGSARSHIQKNLH